LKTEGWKRYKAKDHHVSPEVKRARLWIALAIGVACGIGMSVAAHSVLIGVLSGAVLFGFLMTRRGRIEKL
jgi:hypothetical protein